MIALCAVLKYPAYFSYITHYREVFERLLPFFVIFGRCPAEFADLKQIYADNILAGKIL